MIRFKVSHFLPELLSEYLEMQNANVILNTNTGQTTMASAWKCEFCHSSQVTEVGLAELKQELGFIYYYLGYGLLIVSCIYTRRT